jgi:hypothetical protein
MEKTKLKEIEPPFKVIEFSPCEFGTAIATFACNLQEMLKGAKKTQRYRIDLKTYQVLRLRRKNGI